MKFVAQSKNFSDILTMAALMAAEPLWTRVKVPTSPKNTKKCLLLLLQVVLSLENTLLVFFNGGTNGGRFLEHMWYD